MQKAVWIIGLMGVCAAIANSTNHTEEQKIRPARKLAEYSGSDATATGTTSKLPRCKWYTASQDSIRQANGALPRCLWYKSDSEQPEENTGSGSFVPTEIVYHVSTARGSRVSPTTTTYAQCAMIKQLGTLHALHTPRIKFAQEPTAQNFPSNDSAQIDSPSAPTPSEPAKPVRGSLLRKPSTTSCAL